MLGQTIAYIRVSSTDQDPDRQIVKVGDVDEPSPTRSAANHVPIAPPWPTCFATPRLRAGSVS